MSNRALTLALLLGAGSLIGCGSRADAPEAPEVAARPAAAAPAATHGGKVAVSGSMKYEIVMKSDGFVRAFPVAGTSPAAAISVEVDPKRVLLLDVNYTNNSLTLKPRAPEASLKWSLKWMAWLQDLMLTYAFFV